MAGVRALICIVAIPLCLHYLHAEVAHGKEPLHVPRQHTVPTILLHIIQPSNQPTPFPLSSPFPSPFPSPYQAA